MWCCYAWPTQASKTGKRTFMINQSGDIAATQNDSAQPGGAYDGFVRSPSFDAAFAAAGDMGSSVAFATVGAASQDGLVWTPVGN